MRPKVKKLQTFAGLWYKPMVKSCQPGCETRDRYAAPEATSAADLQSVCSPEVCIFTMLKTCQLHCDAFYTVCLDKTGYLHAVSVSNVYGVVKPRAATLRRLYIKRRRGGYLYRHRNCIVNLGDNKAMCGLKLVLHRRSSCSRCASTCALARSRCDNRLSRERGTNHNRGVTVRIG
jgi:hypothetical protein